MLHYFFLILCLVLHFFFFFFNDTATTEIYTLSLHDALPIHFPYEIVRKFGEIGAFGPTVPQQYGGGGLDYISYGILMQEIERGDSGMRSTASVQGSLVMYPIYKFGSEAQRKKYLPKLASGEW